MQTQQTHAARSRYRHGRGFHRSVLFVAFTGEEKGLLGATGALLGEVRAECGQASSVV